ncbi:hypothetical protein Afil01_63520 [Actinorhabdospora filicis]|uniref:Uncharacterized protein n=1 Tax=Actinorhabdospora filicis TaxID=1785913 RepID=A0A9W6WE57_9ACTN|nr:hypothetical protein [Actinorhabdospora filicis]GLZ81545.1 hypothetical protein Afil01_63520 [Actinorhabdospora filicis]
MKRALITVAILELLLTAVLVVHQRTSGPRPAADAALYRTRAATDELASRVAASLREVAARRESFTEDGRLAPDAAGELTGVVTAVPGAHLFALDAAGDGVLVTVGLRVTATVGDESVTAGRCASFEVSPGADVYPQPGTCAGSWGPEGPPPHLLP